MKTSYQGRAFLAREEGVVLTAYKDSVGVRTIGIGHTTAAGPPAVTSGLTLTLAECFALFEHDLLKYEAGVNLNVHVPLTQSQFDALTSFHYNTGAIGHASFVKLLNAKDYAGAGAGMLAWNKPPEIIGRRKREQHLFLTGDYGNIATVPVWERQGGKVKAMPLPASSGDVMPTHAPIPPTPPLPAPAPSPLPPDVPPVSRETQDDEADPIFPPAKSGFDLGALFRALLALLGRK